MFIKIPKEYKDDVIQSLQTYFYEERSEEIGHLAAESLLDFILKEVSPHIYNQAVKDTKQVVEQRLLHLEEDILSLEWPIKK